MDSGPSFKIYVSNYPHLHNGLIYIFLKKIFLKRNRLWNSQQSRSFRQIEKITFKFYLWTGVTVNGFYSLSHFQTWDIQMSAPFWPAIQLQYPHWPLVIRPPCSSCTSIDSLARCAFFPPFTTAHCPFMYSVPCSTVQLHCRLCDKPFLTNVFADNVLVHHLPESF